MGRSKATPRRLAAAAFSSSTSTHTEFNLASHHVSAAAALNSSADPAASSPVRTRRLQKKKGSVVAHVVTPPKFTSKKRTIDEVEGDSGDDDDNLTFDEAFLPLKRILDEDDNEGHKTQVVQDGTKRRIALHDEDTGNESVDEQEELVIHRHQNGFTEIKISHSALQNNAASCSSEAANVFELMRVNLQNTALSSEITGTIALGSMELLNRYSNIAIESFLLKTTASTIGLKWISFYVHLRLA
jgi:hypothetical protein